MPNLRYYPLMRGMKAVNTQQAQNAANQRAALNTANAPAMLNAPYNPAQGSMQSAMPSSTQTSVQSPMHAHAQSRGAFQGPLQGSRQGPFQGQPQRSFQGPLQGQTAGRPPHGRMNPLAPLAASAAQGQPIAPQRAAMPDQSHNPAFTQPYSPVPTLAPEPAPQPQSVPRSAPQPIPQPTSPSQPSFRPQSMPTANPAELFQRANKNLPDGVRYEPLDEKTLQALRASGKLPAGLAAHSPAPQNPQPPFQPQPQPQPQFQPQPPSPFQPQPEQKSETTGVKPTGVKHTGVKPTDENPIDAKPNDAKPITEKPADAKPNPKAEALERLMQDEHNAQIFYRHLSTLAARTDFKASLNGIVTQCQERLELYASLLSRLYQRTFIPTESAVNTYVTFDEGIALAVMEENKILRALSEWLETLDDNAAVRSVQNIINRKIVDHNLLQFIKADTRSGFAR